MRRVVLALITLAAISPAEAIEGRYRVEGSNPGQTATYRGEAIVRRTGATYTVAWQIGAGRQVGTGLVTGQTFSVMFQAVGSPGVGVASFAILDNRITEGTWANSNTRVVGREAWTMIVAE